MSHLRAAAERPSIPRAGFDRPAAAPGLAALAALTVLLSACSAATPYAPAKNINALGFSDVKIEANRYRVIYRFGPDVGEDRARALLFRRAAELSLENGFDWFRVVTQGALRDDEPHRGQPYPADSRLARTRVGVGFGASGGQNGAAGTENFQLSQESFNVTGRVEILGGKGEKPKDPNVYDCRMTIEETADALRRGYHPTHDARFNGPPAAKP